MKPEGTNEPRNGKSCNLTFFQFIDSEEVATNRMDRQYQTQKHLASYPFCLICHRRGTSIPCNQCKLIFFCSGNCRNQNEMHGNECREFFQDIADLNMKAGIQMMLEKMSMFRNVQELVNFIETSISEEISAKHGGKHTITRNDKLTKLDYIMTIKYASYGDEFWERVEAAYTLITQIPIIQRSFNKKEKRRFLKPLLFYYLSVGQAENDKM